MFPSIGKKKPVLPLGSKKIGKIEKKYPDEAKERLLDEPGMQYKPPTLPTITDVDALSDENYGSEGEAVEVTLIQKSKPSSAASKETFSAKKAVLNFVSKVASEEDQVIPDSEDLAEVTVRGWDRSRNEVDSVRSELDAT